MDQLRALVRQDGGVGQEDRVVPTEGDGNCFFHALVGALRDTGRTGKTHDALRRDLCVKLHGRENYRRNRDTIVGHIVAVSQVLEDLAGMPGVVRGRRRVVLEIGEDEKARAVGAALDDSEKDSILGSGVEGRGVGLCRDGATVDAPVAALLGALAGWRVDLAFLPGFAPAPSDGPIPDGLVVVDTSPLRRRLADILDLPPRGVVSAHLTLFVTRGHFEWIRWGRRRLGASGSVGTKRPAAAGSEDAHKRPKEMGSGDSSADPIELWTPSAASGGSGARRIRFSV